MRISSDQEGVEPRIWIADRFRSYRLRRLSSRGRVEADWHSEEIKGKVDFAAPFPEDAAKDMTKEARAKFHPVDAHLVVRDLATRDGLVFTLLEPGTIGEMAAIDVVIDSSEGPHWRYAVHSDRSVYHDRLAVTGDGFWLFPVAPGQSPKWIERVPDRVMLEAAASSSDRSAKAEASATKPR